MFGLSDLITVTKQLVTSFNAINQTISKISTFEAGVSSVGATGSDGIVITGSPITSSGTLGFSLGGITPTSVAATGTVTGSNLSGTNTGDQTNITGNAATVTTINGKISAGTNITLTGSGTSGSPYSITASGGSPGGSSGQVQYNNSGAFGGAGSLNANAEMVLGGASSTTPLVALQNSSTTVVMTADNIPAPYVASASSEINGSNQAWNAFDANGSTRWIPNTTSNEWLQFDFGPSAIATITAYAVSSSDTANMAPASWTFAGSNDGTTFTTLDTQSGQTWTTFQTKTFTIAMAAYRFFRLTVLTNGGGSLIEVGQLGFTGTALTPILVVANSGSKIAGDMGVGGNLNVGGSIDAATSITGSDLIISDTISLAAGGGTTTIGPFFSGTLIDFPLGTISGIGQDNGLIIWIASATGAGNFFSDANNGDIVYRGTTNLLFGCDTSGGHSQMAISTTSITIYAHISSDIPFIVQGTASQTADLQQWQNSSAVAVSNVDASGNIATQVAGVGFKVKEGTNARMGTGTLSAGTATIANTSVTANTRIFVTDTGGSITNLGSLTVSKSAGVGFTVNSTNILDASTFNWILFEPS